MGQEKKFPETFTRGNVGREPLPPKPDLDLDLDFLSLFVLLSISQLENGKWNGDVCKVGRGYREGGGRSEKVYGGGVERLWGEKVQWTQAVPFSIFQSPPRRGSKSSTLLLLSLFL